MARHNILKRQSTVAERKVYEVLKELKIPFKHRWMIEGKEIDFLIGKNILEIDGHLQDAHRNQRLVELGFIPLHIPNDATTNLKLLKEIIKNLCLSQQAQISSS